MFLIGMVNPFAVQGQTIFQNLVVDYGQTVVTDFVTYAVQGERYPLMHAISKLRYRVLSEKLSLTSPGQTKACSDFRNLGTPVPVDKKDFCQKYDQLVDLSKQGLANLDAFEEMIRVLETWLIREVERQKASTAMKRWIQQKLNCLDELTRCGNDEGAMLTRISKRDPNLLRLYRFTLKNLHKKLFPVMLDSLAQGVPADSPCIFTGKLGNLVVEKGMVFIPYGVFLMGSTEGRENERPVHAVEQDGFWIDRCEVTNAMLQEFLVKDPYLRKSTFPRKYHDGEYLQLWDDDLKMPKTQDNMPVVYVSWFAANYYCLQTGKRLPSEAEWERAARGNVLTQTNYGHGNDLVLLKNYGWFNENSEGFFHVVADLAPNDFQLFDMHGNAWEWVYDWYSPYSSGRVTNPQGPSDGKYRVLRGGSWKSPAFHLRSSMRGDDSPINTSPDVGFRCATDSRPR
ncbi:MAG: SUMF1/EgtB/PvdO family nonheme iron enzyme [SAR324 cluster bacterium]|nr:SUMF1/EgtB/PvdO family nonheme iron enzyme [SAR324 cluster bacterium]